MIDRDPIWEDKMANIQKRPLHVEKIDLEKEGFAFFFNFDVDGSYILSYTVQLHVF